MPGLVQRASGGLARDAARRHVDQDQVVVGAAGDQAETARRERAAQRLGVLDDLLAVAAEVVGRRLFSATAIAAVV